jgi:hypothetical protein
MNGNIKLKNIFITGCYRSGTTLLEKLLHSHKNVVLLSQPFPVLYFYIKQKFLDSIGLKRRYPLDHLFLEDSYELSDFYAFLDRFKISKYDISEIFRNLANYKRGFLTPEILDFEKEVEEGNFIDVYRQFTGFAKRIFPKSNVIYQGSKEILCEEYIPYLISKNIKCILIIRDPRDIISSLIFRKGNKFTGERRPVLYSLRIWRKSVAFAIVLGSHSNFKWLKYENLVINPIKNLNEISKFLDLSKFPEDIFKGGIKDQRGKTWKGNSSFENYSGISKHSLGSFEKKMAIEVVLYIENCCLPEMKLLNYKPKFAKNFSPEILSNFREPYNIVHEKFPEGNKYAPIRCSEEIERYEKLTTPGKLKTKDANRWFLFEEVYRKLSAHLIK